MAFKFKSRDSTISLPSGSRTACNGVRPPSAGTLWLTQSSACFSMICGIHFRNQGSAGNFDIPEDGIVPTRNPRVALPRPVKFNALELPIFAEFRLLQKLLFRLEQGQRREGVKRLFRRFNAELQRVEHKRITVRIGQSWGSVQSIPNR